MSIPPVTSYIQSIAIAVAKYVRKEVGQCLI
uniref:Uncharacterized protein n=1 Tax=Siphoviridae sp. ctZ1O5 TaxID=2825555 RepID=A0A8S5PER1_9CAUD|nr:MAG TPA: hypothetical protein [Siphoviridae sp. ctZ1O5]